MCNFHISERTTNMESRNKQFPDIFCQIRQRLASKIFPANVSNDTYRFTRSYRISPSEKCLYSQFFSSVFFAHSDQKNSKYGHFSGTVYNYFRKLFSNYFVSDLDINAMFIDNFSRSGETFNIVHVYTHGTMKQFNEKCVILGM